MPDLEQNVDYLRQESLKRIRRDVARAYQNRITVVATPDGRSNSHSLDKSRTLRNAIEGLSDDQIIISDPYVEQPNVASVTNSHEYRDLVYESLMILAANGYFNPSYIQDAMKEILHHEYEHHVPGLGQENLEIRYCMSFLEDKARKTAAVQPFIQVSGTFELRILRKIVAAPSFSSHDDDVLSSQAVPEIK